jgi:hypothetical protein
MSVYENLMTYRDGWLDAADTIERPYPSTVFTPMTREETLAVVKPMNAAVPRASERMHAAWARHWAKQLREAVGE